MNNLPDELKKDLSERDIVLFLGAGVNFSLLPKWDDLLNNILEYAINYSLASQWEISQIKGVLAWLRQSPSNSNPKDRSLLSAYEKASLAKKLLKENYIYVVHEFLYRDLYLKGLQVTNSTDPKKLNYLSTIAKLCQQQKVQAVITYNYDNLLEMLVDGNPGFKRKTNPIYGNKQHSANQKKLPIYHVHGYLPLDLQRELHEETNIVLSYEEYYQTMIQPFSWQTSVHLHYLRNCTCLYMGISLRDMNMLRLLNYAQHYCKENAKYILMCEKDIVEDNDPLAKEKKLIRSTLFNDFGVNLLYTGQDYNSLTIVTKHICEYIEQIDKKETKNG